MSLIAEVIAFLKDGPRVFIQPHNCPDHDAIASAFGLQQLLATQDITAPIVYDGEIQRDSVRRMAREFAVNAAHYEAAGIAPTDYVVVVDGCKGNKNVTDIPGIEIAVIDHHEVTCPESVKFVDIQPQLGACSTLIYTYYDQLQIPFSRAAATALMIGINMDTALLTRRVSQQDLQAYVELHGQADIALQNAILRNYIQTKDLSFYRYAIDNIELHDRIAFCYFPDGCAQNLMGILSDFFLSLREADFVLLCARNGNVVNFSIRNEREGWNASDVIQTLLAGHGSGGGHRDMAGGIIRDAAQFDPSHIRDRIFHMLAS